MLLRKGHAEKGSIGLSGHWSPPCYAGRHWPLLSTQLPPHSPGKNLCIFREVTGAGKESDIKTTFSSTKKILTKPWNAGETSVWI
jgi:hypothetical protein